MLSPTSAMTCWKPASPAEYKHASTALAVGLDRRGNLFPPAAARHHRVRRPRSVLGAPQLQPARPQGRDVLRLLPLGRHHDARGNRPGRARTGPPDDPHLLRAGPGPRPGRGPDPHARGRHPRSATSWPTPATPTATPPPGPSRSAAPAPSSSRTCTRTTAAPSGTHHGAIIANGNLYCPATPTTLLELGPLARDAAPEQTAAHDKQTAELARHKLGPITADDADGYHRVICPAVMGKIRCPLRPDSMTLDRSRPEILTPPEHPPACCTQQTITVRRRSRPRPGRNTTTLPGAPPLQRPPHRLRAHLLPGSPGTLPCRGPLRTVHARRPRTRPRQATGVVQVICCKTVPPASRTGASSGGRWRARGASGSLARRRAWRGGPGSPPRSPSW